MSQKNLSARKLNTTGPVARRSIHESWNNPSKSYVEQNDRRTRNKDSAQQLSTSMDAEYVPECANINSRKEFNIGEPNNQESSDEDDKSTYSTEEEYATDNSEKPSDLNEKPVFKNIEYGKDTSNLREPYIQDASEHSQARTNRIFIIALISGLSVIVAYQLWHWLLYPEELKFDMKTLQEDFPTQEDFLWLAFEAGVQDVVRRKKPSTFILLYEQEAEATLTDLVDKLSKYAACNITSCSKSPIEITDVELNSAKVVRDYGTVIEKYRDDLEDKGVMIIRNLENVRGTSAQAFHTFCDEFTPLVKKSLFIFTVKVDELPESSNRMKFIEEYFRRKWTDIKIDTFHALITRITSMVIGVKA